MEPFLAEIRIFPFDFPPRGWALCDGQLLPIAQNTALFSLLGKTYGGDGKTTFALPDLRGAAPMQPGEGPGLSPHELGESSGSKTVRLLESELPAHSHAVPLTGESAGAGPVPPGAAFVPASGGTRHEMEPTGAPSRDAVRPEVDDVIAMRLADLETRLSRVEDHLGLGPREEARKPPPPSPRPAPEELAPAGGGAAHNNMQPYLTLSFCIAMQGIFPPRS